MYLAIQNSIRSSLAAKCKNICSFGMVIVGVLMVFFFIATYCLRSFIRINIIYIHINEPLVHETNEKFLSIALDSSVIASGFHNFDTSNHKLLHLVRPFQPAYFRIGGNDADKLRFQPKGEKFNFFYKPLNTIDGGECAHGNPNQCIHKNFYNFTMLGKEWKMLTKFLRQAGMDIIFDLNAMVRMDNGSWDSENAKLLISYSHKYKIPIHWELGNEPNAFKHLFGYEVKPKQLAEDYAVLRSILDQYELYSNSYLLGPSVTRPRPENKGSIVYMEEFLKYANQSIDVITWHQYYMNGRTASDEDFLNPNILDLLQDQIDIIQEIVENSNSSDLPIWLGETSSAYGGGAPGYSDRFLASFMWIDKLGLSAKLGIDVVIRQSIANGYYALIDENYDPNPDWWVSMLYKDIVGNGVVSYSKQTSENVRLYVHCAKLRPDRFPAYAVTVFGMNLSSDKERVRIEGLSSSFLDEREPFTVYTYELTSDPGLLTKRVYLNGILLELEGGSVPNFEPKIETSRPYLDMPPFSIVFWVIPSNFIEACN